RVRMRKVLVRLMAMQVLFCLICAIALYFEAGSAYAVAAVYGGAVGVVASVLLAWRMGQVSRPGADFKSLYIGAVERMLFALAAFGAGIALLTLNPVGMLVGFGVTQLAYYISAGPLKRYIMRTKG